MTKGIYFFLGIVVTMAVVILTPLIITIEVGSINKYLHTEQELIETCQRKIVLIGVNEDGTEVEMTLGEAFEQ